MPETKIKNWKGNHDKPEFKAIEKIVLDEFLTDITDFNDLTISYQYELRSAIRKIITLSKEL